ncbi:fimbria/pilus outer membrane usher protein [uncultured Oxalicibacterium sp.]|uniref:fimbria/pilus outer membrane usher protein n=1 Tax=uncultured Oxalicibacterium sp. TaxID=1168540 RepID=UPI0025E27B2F|nr:fimbria/pilus outer membrane usher protein [uncultured Oxalicibacterium sp.]
MAKVDIVFLAVSINGLLRDDTIEALQLPNNDLAVAKADLLTWNLSVSSAEELRFNEHVYIRLRDLPELRWRIDTRTQTLILEARADAFVSHQVALTGDRSPAVTPSPPGGFFNYDVQSDYSNGRHAYSGFYGFSVFGEWGTGAYTSVYRSNMVEGFERNVRLDTTWTIDMPEKRQSIWLGDAISYGGTLGRAVRFGGVRWGTNFGLTPGFSTLALPTIRGEAALPSTLDLYINNNYGSQARVPAGPFDLANVPLVTGQGEIRMAVRDLLGREQIITQPYYASQALLKPGLHDFSVEAGSIREDYGFFSNRYGRSFIAATDRVGITPRFTRELRAELLSSQQMLSAGGTWLLGTVGTIGLQAAGSRTTQANGWSSGLSLERQAPTFSSNLVARYATRDFRQLGEIEGRSTRLSAALGFGMPFMGGGLGASYARQTTWQDQDNRIVTLSYSRSVGAQSFISIAATRQSGDARATSIVVSFIHALGLRDSVSAIRSKENQRSFTALQLQRNGPAGPGYGYQINAEDGIARRYSAQGTLNNAYARLNAGVAGAEQGATTYRLGAAGAVAMLNGGLYPTRQIDDSFAVVKVGDYANVNVLRENQQVAKTGRQGYAFVTGLRGYQRNRLSIDQADLPFDAEIDQLDMIVTPAMRSGIAIHFPVRRMASATARLIYRDGTALPPGTVLRVQGQGKNAITGFDGKVFVSSPDLRVHLQSEGPRTCRANLQLQGAAEIVDELGTIVCEESE